MEAGGPAAAGGGRRASLPKGWSPYDGPVERVDGSGAGGTVGRWIRLRWPPLVATLGVLVTALIFSLWWNLHVDHSRVWYEPADLWRTMLASVRLDKGQLSQLYTNGTNLVSFPGAAVILAPAAAVINALHYPLGPPIGTYTDTNAWLVALPYMVVVSCSVLFAADAIARRLGVSQPKRLLLALAGGVALWNVVPYWGHPEDCVSIALLLYGVDAAAGGHRWRAAWLVGLGMAVQPLIALAVPLLAVVSGRRRIVGWVVRAAIPPVVAVGVALAANWSGTWYQIVDQPNWPYIDRPTPWIHLAPHLTSQTVAAGPGRSIAVVLAIVAAWPAWAAWRRAERRAAAPDDGGGAGSGDGAGSGVEVGSGVGLAARATATATATAGHRSALDDDSAPWSTEALLAVVWWVALTIALRCGFESVMVSYYIWGGIAVGMLAAVTSWWRLVPASTLGMGLTAFCNVWWHGEWSWWSVIVVGLALLLTAAHPAIEGSSDARAPTGDRRAGTAARAVSASAGPLTA